MNALLKKLVWLVILAPAAYLALVWKKLPAQVAVHFNLSGQADRFGDKKELLVTGGILLAVNAGIYLLLTNIYRIDPKKYAAENRERLERMAFGISVFMSAILCLIIYSSTRNSIGFKTGYILAGTSLLLAFIGNYMQNIKPNYFAGFRLPWTLEDKDNWKKTHALGGKLWFAGGLVLAVCSLILPSAAGIVVFIAGMLVMTIIPVVFSFRLYRQKKKEKAAG